MTQSVNPNIVIQVEPVTVDRETACRMLGIGITLLSELVSDGKLPAKKLGARTVFVVDDLKRFAATLPAWEPQ